jgi:glycosyltransferase involved in cell wall biosynthesis
MMITSYENGILVPVRDVQALREAMEYVIENPEKAAAIAESAAKIRLVLAVDKIVSEWEQML